MSWSIKMGKVFFVGAGPGDPELLTIKGKRVIEQADVIVYDRLANPLLLYLAKPTARFVFSGKFPKKHVMKQPSINDLLVSEGQKEQIVVRLKGGDPGIFGRIGEEIEQLQKAQVAYEWVPGITAASAAAAYHDFPLTHRKIADQVLFVTAHRREDLVLELQQLPKNATLCFYMGVEQSSVIQEQLLLQGFHSSLPCFLGTWSTTGKQKSYQTTLDCLAETISKEKIVNPTMMIIGEVARMAGQTSWFESLPLFTKKIVLVGSGAIPFEQLLSYTQRGAEVIPIQVGEERDVRFDSVFSFDPVREQADEIIFLDEKARDLWKKKRSE